MLAFAKRLPWTGLACLLAWTASGRPAHAQPDSNFRVSSDPGYQTGYTSGGARSYNNGYGAGFRTAFGSPYFGTGYYISTPDPYGGFLSGSADVISSQGQLLLDVEQSAIVHEKARQARLDTRRKRFDEDLYERQYKPTAVD